MRDACEAISAARLSSHSGAGATVADVVTHIGAVCDGTGVGVDDVVLVAARRVIENEAGAGVAIDNVASDEAADGAGQSVATIANELEPGNHTVGAKADRFSRHLGNRAIDDRYAGIGRRVDAARVGAAGADNRETVQIDRDVVDAAVNSNRGSIGKSEAQISAKEIATRFIDHDGPAAGWLHELDLGMRRAPTYSDQQHRQKRADQPIPDPSATHIPSAFPAMLLRFADQRPRPTQRDCATSVTAKAALCQKVANDGFEYF